MVGAGTAASLGLVSGRGVLGSASEVLASLGSLVGDRFVGARLVGDRTSGGSGLCSDSPSRGAFGDCSDAASPSPDAGALFEIVARSEGSAGA